METSSTLVGKAVNAAFRSAERLSLSFRARGQYPAQEACLSKSSLRHLRMNRGFDRVPVTQVRINLLALRLQGWGTGRFRETKSHFAASLLPFSCRVRPLRSPATRPYSLSH